MIKIHSVAFSGLTGEHVEVEVDVVIGMGQFAIVGLADTAIQESKERVRSAIKNSGYSFSGGTRTTVNLAPADIRKKWPIYDLPIALGIVGHTTILDEDILSESLIMWELALDGTVRSVIGGLPGALFTRELGYKRIFLPTDNILEAAIIPGVDIVAVSTLRDIVDMLTGAKDILPVPLQDPLSLSLRTQHAVDMGTILGQEHAKRALMIAAAGGHNILLQWPPGSGKTMLAKAFASILPPMSLDEIIEVSKIYSIAGLLSKAYPLVVDRPFRKVHHTASEASIVGGGRDARPGEISLSHKWVLFLDEFLEFDKNILETLRQPLEDGEIHVNRVNASYVYPAKFTLFGALNPCPCGYMWDAQKPCICSAGSIEKYRSKLSGPILDRIDIFLNVPRVKTEDFTTKKWWNSIYTNEYIADRVHIARTAQQGRFVGTTKSYNAELSNKDIDKYCILADDVKAFLVKAVERLDLSTRVYFRILRLARTIADIDSVEDISIAHIAEALSYRQGK